MRDKKVHVFLSAHLDDVVLSCGGLIHKLTQNGENVLVVTIFAGRPPLDQALSDLAQSFHTRWGMPEDVLATRWGEDQAAVESLGAEALHLGFIDAIYRKPTGVDQWFYASLEELKGKVHPADMKLSVDIADAVKEHIERNKGTMLYSPLAIGDHVDHQLTLAAALVLAEMGWSVRFFEDYRYVEFASPGSGEAAAKKVGCRSSSKVGLSDKDIEAEICAVKHYLSQLILFTRDDENLDEVIRGYFGGQGGMVLWEKAP